MHLSLLEATQGKTKSRKSEKRLKKESRRLQFLTPGSLHTLAERTSGFCHGTLLVCRDRANFVFGAWSARGLNPNPPSASAPPRDPDFTGDESTVLLRLLPSFLVCRSRRALANAAGRRQQPAALRPGHCSRSGRATMCALPSWISCRRGPSRRSRSSPNRCARCSLDCSSLQQRGAARPSRTLRRREHASTPCLLASRITSARRGSEGILLNGV